MIPRLIFKCAKTHLVFILILIVMTYIGVKYSNSGELDQNSAIMQRNRLIDLKHFEFLINAQKSCDECKDGFLLVILVHTHLSNIAKRTVIRETWGKPSDCVKVLYFIGTTTDKNLTQKIQEENDKHHDIVQGNFMDTYRNLTYKHVMVLKWATEYCQRAKYVVKTDDDLMVRTDVLYDHLKKDFWGATDLIACSTPHDTKVPRSKSKWVVTKDEYSEDRFPDYCLGPFIIYSADVIHRLLEESYNTPYFWIDDVHVTGTLAKRIGIKKHVNLKKKWYLQKTNVLFKKGRKSVKPFIYGPFQQQPANIYKIWKALN